MPGASQVDILDDQGGIDEERRDIRKVRARAIVNPASSNGSTGKQWPAIEEKLRRNLGEVDAVLTAGPGEAVEMTRRALRDGFDWIISVGGDGTLNEVVNGFFDEEIPVNDGAALSVLTSGTGGDFRRTLGLPDDLDEAVVAIAERPVRRIDVGRIRFVGHDGASRTRYFNNIASFGLGGEVDKRVNEMSAFKRLGGSASFLYAGLRSLISYKNKDVRLVVDDRIERRVKTRFVFVANGQYGGGGMWWAPGARLEDGLFDIVIFGDMGRARSILNMPGIYRGTHIDLPDVECLRGRKVTAESDDEVLLDVDGEAPGRLPATFEILPGAIGLKG